MNHLSLTIGVASLIGLSTLGSAAAVAGTLTFSDSLPLTVTDVLLGDFVLTFPKFDSSLGTLDSVEFTLDGTVTGDVRFENISRRPNPPNQLRTFNITSTISSTIELQRPDGSSLVSVIPLVSRVDAVTGFDGTNNFGGASGRTFPNLTNSASETLLFTDVSDLLLFTGSDDIELPILATGTSSASGTGNISQAFTNFAAADVTVVYNFTDAPVSIPESSGILGMGVAVAAVGSFASKRRFKQA